MLAELSRRNDGSGWRRSALAVPPNGGHIDGGHRPEVPVADGANVA